MREVAGALSNRCHRAQRIRPQGAKKHSALGAWNLRWRPLYEDALSVRCVLNSFFDLLAGQKKYTIGDIAEEVVKARETDWGGGG